MSVFGAVTSESRVHVRKTLGESDVYLFAGITGDLNPNHVDAVAMAGTAYGARLVHGALLLGFVSTASTRLIELAGVHAVAYGYDRVRFIRPVFLGDTIDVGYAVTSLDAEARKLTAAVEIRNQDGDLVAVAGHLLHFPSEPDNAAEERS